MKYGAVAAIFVLVGALIGPVPSHAYTICR